MTLLLRTSFNLVMVVVLAVGIFISLFGIQTTEAAVSGVPAATVELDGYLWSSTIGWVSLNCRTGGTDGPDADLLPDNVCASSNYKVTMNGNDSSDPDSGRLSGYAWSSNVGWIKFNSKLIESMGKIPTAPGNTATGARFSGTYPNLTLSGWARACAGTNGGSCANSNNSAVSGGWDGWISLKGGSAVAPTSPFYGVTTNAGNTNAGSFAWGGGGAAGVVGWISFDLMKLLVPTATLTGSPCTIPRGVSTCTTPLGWTFSSPPTVLNKGIYKEPSTSLVASPADSGSTPVTLTAGVSSSFTARTNSIVLDTRTLTPGCGPTDMMYPGPPQVCEQKPPTISIDVDKGLVRSGATVQVTWTITPPAPDTTLSPSVSCRVLGPGVNGVASAPGSTKPSAPIKNATVFRVECTGLFGTVSDEKAVEIIPVTQEI